jgi:O-antigen/teichoic acid export membrane protein
MALVVAPAVAVGVVLAPELLRAFGSEYASTGVTLLRMLLLSLPLYAINFLYSSFAWYDRRVWRMAVANVATAGVYLAVVLSLIGRLGINTIGVASLVASGLEGAYFLPQLVRRYRSLDHR